MAVKTIVFPENASYLQVTRGPYGLSVLQSESNCGPPARPGRYGGPPLEILPEEP